MKMSAFEKKVEEHYQSMVRKGLLENITPERAKTEIMVELARREPQLYEDHIDESRRRSL